jgi:hypothetical protein
MSNSSETSPQAATPASTPTTTSDIDDAARQRREAWLAGPTDAEKEAWAQRERERRLAEIEGRRWPRRPPGDPVRAVQRYVREMQLATEGAMSLLLNVSVSEVFENLVRAGREWEDEFTAQPPRRRRVALSADVDTDPNPSPAGGKPTRVPAPPQPPARPD